MPVPKADPFKPPFPTPRHAIHAYRNAAREVTRGIGKLLDLANSPEAFHGLAADDTAPGLAVEIRKDAAALSAVVFLIESAGGSLHRMNAAAAAAGDETPF